MLLYKINLVFKNNFKKLVYTDILSMMIFIYRNGKNKVKCKI